jgi:hypothetical protein
MKMLKKLKSGMMMLAAVLFQAGTTIEFKADGTFILTITV